MGSRISKDNFFWSKFVEVYRQTSSILIKNPTIWIPFIFLGFADFFVLMLLFFAPSPPMSHVLAPIIRTFYSERFLHYPENFLLLPKLATHAHVLISSVLGVFVTGLAIKKIEGEMHGGEGIPTTAALRVVGRKFFSLFIAWVGMFLLFKVTVRLALPLIPANAGFRMGGVFLLGLIMQSVLSFVLPAIILSEKGFFKGFWSGLLFGIRYVVLASAITFVPMLLVTALSFAKGLAPVLIMDVPESVLGVLIVGIVITVIADIWITSVTAVLFVKEKVLTRENA